MKNHRALKILKIAGFVIAGSAVFGFIVMGLWNWLAPALFGGHRINFWQGLGLFILSKILFGGFHGRFGHRDHWKHRMKERWEAMTPEEREKFRERIQDRCGSFRPQPDLQP